ncbi:MAG TPA: hypothetical protein VFB41_02875 [Solirubrobacteraceae bacterium]|nr:hypothetical protein [Solirubrobacteraceae bacterium]
MSILVRFVPGGATSTEQYDEVIRRLQDAGEFPPDGLEYHVCFIVDGGVRVSEIWDSQEKFAAFGEDLMPVLADVGIDPGEPTVLDVYNTIAR